jgi:murein DD-endopeptidase MepM/ murein hydrolase activator NlpD
MSTPADPAFRLTHPMPEAWRKQSRGYNATPTKHPVTGEQRPHHGIDWPAPVGTLVLAAADGKVAKAEVWSGDAAKNAEGTMVRISHAGGYFTRYFHLSRIEPGIKVGAVVRAGDVIGTVGKTGRVTGAHLHFELVRPDFKRLDPAPYLAPPPLASV